MAAFRHTRRRRRASRGRRAAVVLFLLLPAAAAALYLSVDGARRGADADAQPEPPLLQAEPIKTVPKDPGGLEIPHQDISVYTRLNAAPAAPAEAVAVSPATPESAGEYVVQLASFSRREEAEAAIPRLRGRFPGLLAGAPLRIQSADLGARGLRHRVRAGAFAAREDARRLCQALRRHGQECRVAVR